MPRLYTQTYTAFFWSSPVFLCPLHFLLRRFLRSQLGLFGSVTAPSVGDQHHPTHQLASCSHFTRSPARGAVRCFCIFRSPVEPSVIKERQSSRQAREQNISKLILFHRCSGGASAGGLLCAQGVRMSLDTHRDFGELLQLCFL